jgi:sulfane dehydrogenase subunit SoxC
MGADSYMWVCKLFQRKFLGVVCVMASSGIGRAERALEQELRKTNGRLDKREFLVVAAAAATSAAIPSSAWAQTQVASTNTAPSGMLPQHRHEPFPNSRTRPTFVKDVHKLVDLNGTNQGSAYWTWDTYITPTDQFFIRNEYATPRAADDPRVDPRTWTLKIHGDGVERELTITYDDLLRMPSRTLITTLECAGNGRTLFWEQQNMTSGATQVTGTGWGLGGVGQAEFTYVPMSHILGLVGLKAGIAKHCLFWSGVDGKAPNTQSDTGRPVPIETITLRGESVGLAFKMNGMPLPPDHGGPVRAIIPGWCGAASTKWLTEIKIASHQFWVRLNSTAHVMIGPDYPAPKPAANDEFRFLKPADIKGQAVTWSPPRSLITVPLVLEKQPKVPHNYPLQLGEVPKLTKGKQFLKGYAWAPQHGVQKVDIRIDGGPWVPVRMTDAPINRYTWMRFEHAWDPGPGRHVIETRTTDKQGNVQPDKVPFNQGGFNFWAIPKFKVDVV